MKCGIVTIGQLGRTKRWDASFNLELAEMEERLKAIGSTLVDDEDDPNRFDSLVALIEESDEKDKSGRPRLRTVIHRDDLGAEDKASMAAMRLFKDPMLHEYLPADPDRDRPEGKLYRKWLTFFTSYSRKVIKLSIQSWQQEVDRMNHMLSKIENP